MAQLTDRFVQVSGEGRYCVYATPVRLGGGLPECSPFDSDSLESAVAAAVNYAVRSPRRGVDELYEVSVWDTEVSDWVAVLARTTYGKWVSLPFRVIVE